MTTLKAHEHLVAELHTYAFSKSTEVLSHAVLDILKHLNATTEPNNNDALLDNDLKACAPQNASESAIIKELEEIVRKLVEQNGHLRRELSEANRKFYEVEQAGCRKYDTQISPCEHEWKDTGRELYCKKCKVHPSDLPQTADDGWVEWAGGKRPVDSTTLIEVRFRNGQQYLSPAIHHYEWRHFDKWSDIIAYRVVKP